MPEFSRRPDLIPPYLFSELARKIEAKRKEGIDVISLGSADPDIPTPEVVVEALRRGVADASLHRYPSNRGLAAYRQAAVRFMADRFGVPLDPEREILPALGGKEAVHHLCVLCLDDRHVCLAPDPGYPVYASGPILAGAGVYPLPLRAGNGFLPDLDAIPADVARRANLLFLNYPNNPTGAIAPDGFFDRAVAFARRNDLIVVHDNAYSEIAFDGYRPPSFLATPGAKDVGVEVFSLSKGWNMTGWRVGWVAGNADIVERYARLKPNIDAGMFGAVQMAAVAALTEAPDFPRRMSAIYQARRNLMVASLASIGLKVDPPRATPFLWVPIPDGYSSTELADRFLERAHVVVSPGVAFGAAGEGYIRFSLTVPDDRWKMAAQRIEASLRVN